jgi:hypothetical protein
MPLAILLQENMNLWRMNRVQFFYDDELITLQEKINMWLIENRDAKIIATNLSSLGKPSPRAGIVNTEKHVFYILYNVQNLAAKQELRVAEEEMYASQAFSATMVPDKDAGSVTN